MLASEDAGNIKKANEALRLADKEWSDFLRETYGLTSSEFETRFAELLADRTVEVGRSSTSLDDLLTLLGFEVQPVEDPSAEYVDDLPFASLQSSSSSEKAPSSWVEAPSEGHFLIIASEDDPLPPPTTTAPRLIADNPSEFITFVTLGARHRIPGSPRKRLPTFRSRGEQGACATDAVFRTILFRSSVLPPNDMDPFLNVRIVHQDVKNFDSCIF